MRQRVMRGFLLGTTVLSIACGDSAGPETVAGTYVATVFTLSGATDADVLAAGGSITMTLKADGTTTGTFFVPASLNGGTDFTADLSGTFTVTGQALHFTQVADTFIRDVTWVIETNQLRGMGTFTGVTVSAILTRQ
jgi:hypothetical protein